jgi:signal transduction histidine kinase
MGTSVTQGAGGLHTVGRNGRPVFNLVRWFTILSFLSISLTSIATALVLSNFLRQQFVYREAEVMTEFINGIIDVERRDKVTGNYAEWIAGDLEEFFYHLGGMPDVLNAKVYRPDGLVVWSTDASLIGQRFDRNEELESAFQGEPVIHVSARGKGEKDEHEYLKLLPGTQFVESYLPIWHSSADKRRIDGVVEIYRAPRRLFETIDSGIARIWACALTGGALIFLALFGVVRHAAGIIRRQEREIVAAEMLAAVGEMASAVAHSLRNPLSSVRSSAELALASRDEAQARAAIEEILVDTDRLETWIRQYLANTQAETGADGVAEVGPAVRQTLDNLEHALRRNNVRTTLDLAPDLPRVRPSTLTLVQVLNGIVANAIEAMPGGGTIGISVRGENDGDRVRIDIADTGAGLPDTMAETLFDPFTTTKSTGFGLGLPLARRIVARYGGQLTLSNGNGQGAVATLLLPSVA